MDVKPGTRAALSRVLRNGAVRRLQLALAAVMLAGAGYQVALAVVAFAAGGQRAVGLAFAVQLLPIALTTPIVSSLADRYPRRRVMVGVDVLRCSCTAAVAVAVALGAPLGVVLALGAPGALLSTAYAPASRALLPALADATEELAAANAVSSGIERLAYLAGPAIAGLLITLWSPAAAFGVAAALFLLSAVTVVTLRVPTVATGAEPQAVALRRPGRAEALEGLRTIARDRSLRVLVGTYAAVTLAYGAVQVFAVAIARDLAGFGDAGVGTVFSAIGGGGIVGALCAVVLVERLGEARTVALGAATWGISLALIGLVASRIVAVGGCVTVGVADVVVDVAVVTLLQQAVADEVLGRVFGVLEMVLAATVGLGALLAPVLAGAIGTRAALAVSGCLLPLLVAALWGRLRRVDAVQTGEVRVDRA